MYLQYTSHLQSTVYYDYAWFTKKLQIHDVTQKNFPHFLPFPIYVSEYFQCKICTRGTWTHYLNISLVFVLVIICCFLTQTVQKSEKNCKNRKFSSTINYFLKMWIKFWWSNYSFVKNFCRRKLWKWKNCWWKAMILIWSGKPCKRKVWKRKTLNPPTKMVEIFLFFLFQFYMKKNLMGKFAKVYGCSEA